MERILLVDDEPGVLAAQRNLLRLNGFNQVLEAQTAQEARILLARESIDLVLLDLTLPEESGQELLKEMTASHPDTEVIVVTGASDVTTAVHCMRIGAYDFLVKGSDSSRIPAAVRNALDHHKTRRENRLLREAFTRQELRHPEAFETFITKDPGVLRVLVYLEALATIPDPLLISGETGVGKELIARGVHRASGRDGQFIAVNMGGLDDHVFSDTIFGHKKGAFTGADGARDGLITAAANGTLFLDEVGEMPGESQARLLRLLDTGEFFRLGSDRPEYSRARIIFATNRDLQQEVDTGAFRRDLFFRIATHHVHLPPLRDRPEDIAPIMRKLVAMHASRIQRQPISLSEQVIDQLTNLPLYGNVRELQQIALRALIEGDWAAALPDVTQDTSRGEISGSVSPEIEPPQHSPPITPAESGAFPPGGTAPGNDDLAVRFSTTLPTPDEALRWLLREADRRHPESRTAAARAIGLSPQAFANRWKRMFTEPRRYTSEDESPPAS
ncbi:MAG: sigma-54-dependent transcriptional regulator [Alkalispirochaeta sp.]